VGRGENKKIIPPDEVYKLAALHCNYQEIADWFGIKRETLKYNFRDIIQKAYSETNQRLRRAQIETAMKGNAVMLVWLGKNMLNQSDSPMSNENTQPLPWSDDE
jgi:predicted transcriptional regulator